MIYGWPAEVREWSTNGWGGTNASGCSTSSAAVVRLQFDAGLHPKIFLAETSCRGACETLPYHYDIQNYI